MSKTLGRLRRKADFDRLYRRGVRLAGYYLFIRCLPNREPQPRLAIVISTKIDKRAVIRNRHRRQIRAVLQELWAESLKLTGDILITVQRPVLDRSKWPEFREELRTLLKRQFAK